MSLRRMYLVGFMSDVLVENKIPLPWKKTARVLSSVATGV